MKGFDFEWQDHTGETIVVKDTHIVPHSRALLLKHPFGGVVCNRPQKLIVYKEGQLDEIPIADPTRRAIWGMMEVVGVITAVVTLIRKWKESRGEQNE